MSKFKIWIACIGALAAALLLYHLDTFIGNAKFHALCKNDAGARYYKRIDKDVGWLVQEPVSGLYTYMAPFQFEHVAFVRWRNRKGEQFDVYRDPGFAARPYPKPPSGEFILTAIDEAKPVRYQYLFERSELDDPRFERSIETIINLSTGAVVATFTQYSYQWTKPERVILNAPTSQQCGFTFDDYRNFRQSIYSFKSK